jgi:hypothetical protein
MHEIRVSISSPEAADCGVAELWAADELIGYTMLEDSDLMLRIEPRHDRPRSSSARAASRRRSVKPSTYSSTPTAPSRAERAPSSAQADAKPQSEKAQP